jgi:hypothetical protein
MWSSCVAIRSLLVCSFVIASECLGFAKENILLVQNSKTNCMIVLSQGCPDQVRRSAETLVEYVQKSTGATMTILNSNNSDIEKAGVRIWLGANVHASTILKRVGSIAEDGFVIAFPTSKDIVITSHTNWGIEFGVYEFLERYVGIRWLYPGASGEYIPHLTSLSVPAEEIKQEPGFKSRMVSGLKGPEQGLWVRRNRLHFEIAFQHNMANIIPPLVYGKSNPEFYSMQKGRREVPDASSASPWQPCFSSSSFVDTAISQIDRYFATHQGVMSFSLGINDGGNPCECEACLKAVKNDKNIFGAPNYSNIYYRWVDKVASGVLRSFPGKSFGCLAYEKVFSAPDTSVDPSVIPFVTYETAKCVSSTNRTEFNRTVEDWSKVTNKLGWYDYIYGVTYLVPRIYFHTMAESYRYLFSNGVRAMYAEAYPNFGEGPKLYLALKLMWNPQLNVDSTLKDWYVSAVGVQSAPYLEQYFSLWEGFWSQRILNSPWFQQKRIYSDFLNPGYLDIVTEDDMNKSRSLLTEAVNHSSNEFQKACATKLLRAFEYYDLSVHAYRGLVKGELGIHPLGYYEDLNHKRLQLLDEFETDAALVHPLRFDIYPTLRFK